jgi:hypothetical protein
VILTGTSDNTTTIASPTIGIMVYDTPTDGTSPANVTPVFCDQDGTKWQRCTNQEPYTTISLNKATPCPYTVACTWPATPNPDHIHVSSWMVDNRYGTDQPLYAILRFLPVPGICNAVPPSDDQTPGIAFMANGKVAINPILSYTGQTKKLLVNGPAWETGKMHAGGGFYALAGLTADQAVVSGISLTALQFLDISVPNNWWNSS